MENVLDLDSRKLGMADGGLWSPGDDPRRFIDTLDVARSPRGLPRFRIDWGLKRRIGSFILGSARPDALMPGPGDGRPKAMRAYRIDTDRGSTMIIDHDDYPVDPRGLDAGGVVLKRDVMRGLYINPVLMYRDILALTDDPEAALAAMGFRRALRLSTLSRFRIGGLGGLGVSRRRLFRMAAGMDGEDIDRMLDIVADTAYVAGDVPGLPTILRRYKGLPVAFIVEDLAAAGL